jgi:septum formation protein
MLVLASASPARQRLLLQAAIPPRVRVSGVDEGSFRDGDPRRLVRRLAEAKARAVADSLPGDAAAVLGCDSLLLFDGEVFGKPADVEEASARWQRMAGGWAELHTGHCLLAGGEAAKLETVTTRVRFAALSAEEIAAYVATGEPLACAGGFALEGRGGALVERIEGCFSNVIGLSLPLLRRWLAAAPGARLS